MISAESRQGRRIVGNLDRGDALLEALRDVCRDHNVRCGELRAMGALAMVSLAVFDQHRRDFGPTRELSGSLELLSLRGSISECDGALSVDAHATLARDRDSGLEVVGGRVRAGTVYAVEYVIDAMDDIVLRRRGDRDTGLALWTEVLTETDTLIATPPPSAPTPPASRPHPEPSPTQPTSHELSELHPGDVLVHPKFGRCTVMRIEGDQEFVHVRLRNGRIVRLSLEVLTLQPQGTDDGQRVFTARIE